MSKDFLLEIFSEDLPARFVDIGIYQLKTNSETILKKNELNFKSLNTYGTPRRLILHVEQLDEKQKDKVVEKKGPSKKIAIDFNGDFTKAAVGFAKSCGVEVENLDFIKDNKGEEYLYVKQNIKGQDTKELLPEIISYIFSKFRFPKTMYWDETKFLYPRPVRGLLILFGDEKIDFSIAGISSSDFTFGHRFLSDNKKITVSNVDEYFKLLKKNYVIYNQNERRQKIIADSKREIDLNISYDENLLNTVVNLVEYPVVQLCEFDKIFLRLPSPIIILEMKEHQKYFPVFDDKGRLSNYFLVVLNNNKNKYTKAGNERVLTARLKDAEFFINEDLKVNSLEDYNEGLSKVLQHEKIGTLKDKVENIRKITDFIIEKLNISDNDLVEAIKRTALLCKSDLLTNAVFEFTELQGIIGGEYARRLGEKEEVALGIAEHYKPVGSDDSVPESITGSIVGIADKIDTITGGFLAGLKPTSSKDPYQIKRAAFGIIKILIEKKFELDLSELIKYSLSLYNNFSNDVYREIEDFFKVRIETVLKEKGIFYDETDAILSADFSNIYNAYLKISLLHNYRQKESFLNLIIALKRMTNIIKDVESFSDIREDKLIEDAEKTLFDFYKLQKMKIEKLEKEKKYEEIFKSLSEFKNPVDDFFDKVLVMDKDDELKNNRLALLNSIVLLFKKIIDFDKIVIK